MSSFKALLWKWCQKYFDLEIHGLIRNQIKKLEDEREESTRQYAIYELDQFVNKPVICLSNEWKNPIIGYGTRIDFITQAMNPVLCVHNYLDGQEYVVLGSVFHFNEQRFNALFKLNPFELCSFIYGRYMADEFDKAISEERNGKEEIQELLETNGFYKRLLETQ